MIDRKIIDVSLEYAMKEYNAKDPAIGNYWVKFCDGKKITYGVQVFLSKIETVSIEVECPIVIESAKVIGL